MKKLMAIVGILMLLFYSCKDDEAGDCRTCSSEITTSFELCKESNGNASVNGQNTGVSYAIYLEGLVSEGVSCN